MRFEQLKPLRGWREFAGEVGIIVLGVLIALGAQQVVQRIQERKDVAQLRSAFRAELADDRARWEDMRAADRCTLQRLDALESWAANAPAGARLVRAYRIMLWNMHSSAWDIAKASPAAADIPLGERLTYADLYAAIDNWREMLAEERANAVELSALLGSADQSESRRQIRLHVAKARIFVNRRSENYPYFFTRFDALRIRPDSSQLTIARNPKALCAPLESLGKAANADAIAT
jgi:hypothetical protein